MPSPPEGEDQEPPIPNDRGRLSPPAPVLDAVLAKSASHSGKGRAETLAEHSGQTRDAVLAVAGRIGPAGPLARYPEFWAWAQWAALLHDAGKIAAGFQLQLERRDRPWGERHEVLSLAYVDLLAAGLPDDSRAMIAAGVLFHHRCLDELSGRYPTEPEHEGTWKKKFGFDACAGPDKKAASDRHAALLAWLAAQPSAPSPSRTAGTSGSEPGTCSRRRKTAGTACPRPRAWWRCCCRARSRSRTAPPRRT